MQLPNEHCLISLMHECDERGVVCPVHIMHYLWSNNIYLMNILSACVCGGGVGVGVGGGGLNNVLPHYLRGLRWFQMHRLSRATEEPNHLQPTNQLEVHARTQLVKTPCHQLREVPCQPEVHAVTNPVHMHRLPAAKHLASQRSVQWPGLLNYYSVPITITSYM